MKSFAVVFLAVAGVVGGYLFLMRARPSVEPIVFFDGLLEHTDDIWQSCPNVAFSIDKEASDYRLFMVWDKDHWRSMLTRGETVLLMKKDSPDFNQLVREACRTIKPDAETWLSAHRKRIASEPLAADESNRYELRDIHDGGNSVSALLDKRTGKVWAWQAAWGRFVQQEVTPEPK